MSNEEENGSSDRDIQVFVFNDRVGEYEELALEDNTPLYDLLDPDNIFLFIAHRYSTAWIWQGSNTTTRMKFISARIAPRVRDQYGFAYRLLTEDEGNESTAFKIMIGLESASEDEEKERGPIYKDTEEHRKLLEDLSLRDILLLLEKVGIPEGYERKIVIVNKEVYRYKEVERNYLGSVIKEKKLFPLKEQVPDGPYLAENYVPQILFSFNEAIIVELLEKKEIDENEKK